MFDKVKETNQAYYWAVVDFYLKKKKTFKALEPIKHAALDVIMKVAEGFQECENSVDSTDDWFHQFNTKNE